MSLDEENLLDTEVQELLRKCAIIPARVSEDQFASNIFSETEKKNGRFRPIINLKKLNQFIPYLHFKMEGPKQLKDLLRENNLMVKIDLKDAYFSIPLHLETQKYVRFQWKGNLYQFLCLCFGLGSASRIFTKLLKIPISILQKINIWLIIYLDDILIMLRSLEEILMSRDTAIFQLQHLGFAINLQKSKLEPNTKLEFSEVEMSLVGMTMYLPGKKVTDITNQCNKLLSEENTTLRELTSLIGKLISTYQAVLPAPLHFRSLQMHQITKLRANLCNKDKVSLNAASLEELKWRRHNPNFNKGRPIKIQNPVGCSKIGRLGGTLTGAESRGSVEQGGSTTPHKCFWNESRQIGDRVILQGKKPKSVHLQIDNVTALSHLMKMGWTKTAKLNKLLKEIWEYLIGNNIALTSQALKTFRRIGNHAMQRTQASGNCVPRHLQGQLK